MGPVSMAVGLIAVSALFSVTSAAYCSNSGSYYFYCSNGCCYSYSYYYSSYRTSCCSADLGTDGVYIGLSVTFGVILIVVIVCIILVKSGKMKTKNNVRPQRAPTPVHVTTVHQPPPPPPPAGFGGPQQYPPPGQQYPPPGQQYPPPGQQYPPPGDPSYPPPPAYPYGAGGAPY